MTYSAPCGGLFIDWAKAFQIAIHRCSDRNAAVNPVPPYPFAIFEFTLWREPRRAMTREFAGDFVEDERPRKENAAIKSDFLDFHASPFALAITALASSKASISHSPSSFINQDKAASALSSAESKSGAAEMR